MAFDDINPERAHALMNGDPKHVYLDVRTPQEFERGHAPGAVNVPILLLDAAGQMTPNPRFLDEAQKRFAKDAPLVVGCKMGGRSRRACQVLDGAGFTRVSNVDGGFGGNPDADDESAQRGWAGSGLPVETGKG